ncbi:MAG: hypothetical protein ACLFN1_06010 [Bacteroidales bacterium]
MKKNLLLLFVFSVSLSAVVFSQEPVEYPDAIPGMPGIESRYLTSDPYEKVKAFYVNVYGEPDYETKQDDNGRSAQFFYEESIVEPRAVHIYDRKGDSKAVEKVFSQLNGMVVREIIDQELYDEIEEKYIHLKDYYYVKDEDQKIFDRYHKKLGTGGTEAVVDREETMMEAQRLIMAGKVEEGRAMLENMKNSMAGAMDHANSPDAADEWVECLEEISAIKYPVMIIINR